MMKKNFAIKLMTDNYYIGSFDAYIEMSKHIIGKNAANTTDADQILKTMSTEYRAAIVSRDSEEYIGYIGLFDIDAKNGVASIRLETDSKLKEKEKLEIVGEYKKFMKGTLNIPDIERYIYVYNNGFEKEKNEIIHTSNIIMPNKMLESGISEETLEKFSQDYSIPKLYLPFTIKSKDRVIGIMGLSNLQWPNKRAQLRIYLDKSLGSDISNELSGYLIDDYIDYVHSSKIHNLNFSVNGSNKDMIDIMNNTKMNYWATLPYSEVNGENIESGVMFQHLPHMEKQTEIIIPDNHSVSMSKLDTGKSEPDKEINLADGFRFVSPKVFEEKGIDVNKIVDGHVKAMQNRDNYTAPLGEDKYILQRGNEKYGLYKAVLDSNYMILDEKNNYCGYVNIISSTANSKHAEIEIGISPELQHKGLGTVAINKFYDQLFSIGYASITSVVFDFNTPSLKLHEKVAELNGVRLESYYINNKLWDMIYYTKVNDVLVEGNNYNKHM